MDKLVILAVFAVVCVAPVAFGQQVFQWNVREYPDPFSFDTYFKCGRSNKSNICDPNNLITKEQADKIDSLIWSVYRETRCQCASCIANSHGYVIRVAIMPRMESIFNERNDSVANLRDAQMFAYMLSGRWSMAGTCNAALLILYSRFDGILYTLTLQAVREVLRDETVKRITMSVRPLFDDKDTIAMGLQEMILRYKMVFEGKEDVALRPKVGRQSAGGAGFLSVSVVSLLLSALVAITFL